MTEIRRGELVRRTRHVASNPDGTPAWSYDLTFRPPDRLGRYNPRIRARWEMSVYAGTGFDWQLGRRYDLAFHD